LIARVPQSPLYVSLTREHHLSRSALDESLCTRAQNVIQLRTKEAQVVVLASGMSVLFAALAAAMWGWSSLVSLSIIGTVFERFTTINSGEVQDTFSRSTPVDFRCVAKHYVERASFQSRTSTASNDHEEIGHSCALGSINTKRHADVAHLSARDAEGSPAAQRVCVGQRDRTSAARGGSLSDRTARPFRRVQTSSATAFRWPSCTILLNFTITPPNHNTDTLGVTASVSV
jgi:hypothetical protein